MSGEQFPDLDLRCRVYGRRVHLSGEWDQPFDGTEEPRSFFSADFNLAQVEKIALPVVEKISPKVGAFLRLVLKKQKAQHG